MVIAYINAHPNGTPEGEASLAAHSNLVGLALTAPDAASISVQANRGLPANLTARLVPAVSVTSMVGSPIAENEAAPAKSAAIGLSRMTSGSDFLTAPVGAERVLDTSSRADRFSASAANRIRRDSVLSAVDGCLSPLEDVLQDITDDIDRAWHGTRRETR